MAEFLPLVEKVRYEVEVKGWPQVLHFEELDHAVEMVEASLVNNCAEITVRQMPL